MSAKVQAELSCCRRLVCDEHVSKRTPGKLYETKSAPVVAAPKQTVIVNTLSVVPAPAQPSFDSTQRLLRVHADQLRNAVDYSTRGATRVVPLARCIGKQLFGYTQLVYKLGKLFLSVCVGLF